MIDIVPQVIFKSRFSVLPPKTSHGYYLLSSIQSHSNSHVHGGFKCLALLVWCSSSWKDQINLRSGFCKDTNSKLHNLLIGTTTDHFVCRQTILYRQRIARHIVRRTLDLSLQRKKSHCCSLQEHCSHSHAHTHTLPTAFITAKLQSITVLTIIIMIIIITGSWSIFCYAELNLDMHHSYQTKVTLHWV